MLDFQKYSDPDDFLIEDARADLRHAKTEAQRAMFQRILDYVLRPKWRVIGDPPPMYALRFNSLEDPQEYAIVHPSTREPGRVQVTYIDDQGPRGHATRDTLHDVFRPWSVTGGEPLPPHQWEFDRAGSEISTENRSRSNPAQNPDTDRARALFLDFHQFEPREVSTMPGLHIPTKMWYVGNPTTMYYTSDKLNPTTGEDEGTIQYYHDHGTGDEAPRLYLSDDSEGGELRSIPPWICGNNTTLCLIGQGDGFDFTNFEGDDQSFKGTRPYPKWYATSNGKALLLIQGDKEVLAVIWGGKLRVEPRGVVG